MMLERTAFVAFDFSIGGIIIILITPTLVLWTPPVFPRHYVTYDVIHATIFNSRTAISVSMASIYMNLNIQRVDSVAALADRRFHDDTHNCAKT